MPILHFTLKSGIENMLKSMLNDEKIQVEAISNLLLKHLQRGFRQNTF
jgi:Fe-S cluster biogenesis protein NfuA